METTRRTIEHLQSTLTNAGPEDWCVCEAAIEVLGKIEEPHAVEVLISVFEQSSKTLEDEHGDDDTILLACDVAESINKTLLSIRGSYAVEPLTAALKNGYQDIRNAACEALARQGDSLAVAALCLALKHSEPPFRKHVATVLGATHDAVWVEPLIEALSDTDSGVRSAAQTSLTQITGKTFFVGNGNPDKWRRWWGENKEKEMAAIRQKKNDAQHSAVRLIDQATVLGSMGDPRKVLPLVEEAYRLAASQGLTELAAQAKTILDQIR